MDKGTTPIILRYLKPRNLREKLETIWDSFRGANPGGEGSLIHEGGGIVNTDSIIPNTPYDYLQQRKSPYPSPAYHRQQDEQEENNNSPLTSIPIKSSPTADFKYDILLQKNKLKQRQNIEYIVSSHWPDVELPNPSLKISDYMFKAFEKYGDRTALIDSLTHKSLSFSDLLKKSQRLAGSLSLRSVSYGHMAMIISSNTPDFLPIFLALNKLGATVSLISPQSTKDELLYYLKETKTQTVFAQYSLIPLVRDALNQVQSFKQDNLFVIEPLTESYTSMIEQAPFHHMPANYPATNASVTDLCPKIFTVSDLCRENVELPVGFFDNNKNDREATQQIAIVPFSSGTTGKPKGVMLSNHNILCNILQSQVVNLDPEPRVISGLLPFFHIYGFTVNLLNSLSLGHTVVTFSTIEPSIFLNGLEEFKVSFLFIVPTVAQFLNNYRHLRKFNLSHIKTVFNGASKLSKFQADNFKQLFSQPIQIAQGYGMTEMSPVSHAMPLDAEYKESIGMTVPNTYSKIVDCKTKKSLPPNEKGELCIKGPQIMIGYLNNTDATAEMIVDGWLHTGDIAYYDEEGSFYITDRMKELIKYKGFQVAPAEVESVLLTHPDIFEAVVIGVPEENVGELPTAFIVPKNKKLTPSSIHSLIADKLSAHKWLRGGIHFVPSIPKSASGKILRKDMKAMAMEKPSRTLYYKYSGN